MAASSSSAEKKYQLIPKHRVQFASSAPSSAAKQEKAMRSWEKQIHRKYPEEKVVVHAILDRWIALLFKGHPVPVPDTRWEQIAAEGFQIFISGLREAGASF